ncbi:acetyltransferase [Billgrantia gudaonensis]|uniref:Transferase hexapeptide (Six repeat-containing protein) n=1 Tax=Billgrantia gudaonensis TaxID=376427 RepID=A0A1G8QXS6_9GAMM|nr:acetyltransferase [Halomonas gudaonensis]SDJ09508.1 transferase hexapeptide (six repeat-containing protein) [Halomonas gudaonensis]
MKLAILGASGHGKVVADTALQAGWTEVVFYDDAWPELEENGAWSVAGDTAALLSQLAEFEGVVVGIGNNRTRLAKTRKLACAGARLATIVHPRAVVSSQANIGRGSVVFAGAVIQVDSQLGEACIVNTNASIDHDCQLAPGIHVCPGVNLAGLVTVGEACWIGIGASVKQQVRIGAGVTVGAGAAVIRDIPDGEVVVGVPARAL